jgi:hypothetical protein
MKDKDSIDIYVTNLDEYFDRIHDRLIEIEYDLSFLKIMNGALLAVLGMIFILHLVISYYL